eukprot:scaffold220488_cov17-Tisochrysis_lutea.AAC.2
MKVCNHTSRDLQAKGKQVLHVLAAVIAEALLALCKSWRITASPRTSAALQARASKSKGPQSLRPELIVSQDGRSRSPRPKERAEREAGLDQKVGRSNVLAKTARLDQKVGQQRVQLNAARFPASLYPIDKARSRTTEAYDLTSQEGELFARDACQLKPYMPRTEERIEKAIQAVQD